MNTVREEEEEDGGRGWTAKVDHPVITLVGEKLSSLALTNTQVQDAL